MSKSTVAAPVVAIVTLALAFVLNPSPEMHREKIKEVVAKRSEIEHVLGVGRFIAFASTYHSLGIASYTSVNSRITSVGVIGMVFVMD